MTFKLQKSLGVALAHALNELGVKIPSNFLAPISGEEQMLIRNYRNLKSIGTIPKMPKIGVDGYEALAELHDAYVRGEYLAHAYEIPPLNAKGCAWGVAKILKSGKKTAPIAKSLEIAAIEGSNELAAWW